VGSASTIAADNWLPAATASGCTLARWRRAKLIEKP
jgi:hypothetical protein